MAREGAKPVLADENRAGTEVANAIGGDAWFVQHDVTSEEQGRVVIAGSCQRGSVA